MDPTTLHSLSRSHWEYVRALLERSVPDDMSYSKAEYIQNVGFHYQTALEHGVKHGIQWANERSKNLGNA